MLKYKLSILIPTVNGREAQFELLYNLLDKQKTDEVEILSLKDNKEMTIGAKRQRLYEMAKGEWSVQIDDDDAVSEDYIPTILESLQNNPDCVCYFEHILFNSVNKVSCHSNTFADWGENLQDGDNFYHYIRTPFFKDVIRTKYCLQVGVKDMRYAEDIDFSRRLKQYGLIKSEVFINEFMYFYTYNHLTESQMRERYGIK